MEKCRINDNGCLFWVIFLCVVLYRVTNNCVHECIHFYVVSFIEWPTLAFRQKFVLRVYIFLCDGLYRVIISCSCNTEWYNRYMCFYVFSSIEQPTNIVRIASMSIFVFLRNVAETIRVRKPHPRCERRPGFFLRLVPDAFADRRYRDLELLENGFLQVLVTSRLKDWSVVLCSSASANANPVRYCN